MESHNLDERAKQLEERFNRLKGAPLLAVRLDFLKKAIDDLDSNEELKSLFGEPVSKSMTLVCDLEHKEMLIADANIDRIDKASELIFLKILHEILEKEA
ncbi:MAG: hypothetical protein V1744_07250 [Candidatus Altiarchaeota archaeon]